MASNLRPYRLSRIDELTYSFTTDDGDIYKCLFISYADYFANHPHDIASRFYAFNLELSNPPIRHKAADKRIAETVITIVGDFLNLKINAVVYVCDNSDNREAARSRKFLSWYDYDTHSSNKILKVSSGFEIGGITLYTALLVHIDNKLKGKLIQAYIDLIDTNK